MKKKLQSGFTLIELLVVIAIIGILASVVLASLNTARAKGADAAVKANLANVRPQAEIFYDGTGNSTYGTAAAAAAATCSASTFLDATARAGVAAAVTASGGSASTDQRCAIGVGGASWAASVPLKTNTATAICVDSSGQAKTTTTATPALGGGTAVAICP